MNVHLEINAYRKQSIERVFADAKEKYGLRYTRHKGKKRVQDEVLLVFACMNLKKMALWMTKIESKTVSLCASSFTKLVNFLQDSIVMRLKNEVLQPLRLKYPVLSIV